MLHSLLNKNDLFLVVDRQLETFPVSMQDRLHYTLTLSIFDNEVCSLVLTPPGLPFYLSSTGIKQVVGIYFSDFFVEFSRKSPFSVLGDLLRQAENGGLTFPDDTTRQLREQIIELKTKAGFESGMQLLHVMKTLVESKCAMPLLKGNGLSAIESRHATGRINKVLKYVRTHFRKPIKISEIAGEIGFSAKGFSSFFKKKTGLNFSDYVNEVRIEESVRLLKESDDTVAGIAYSCGFNSAAYFCEVFKRNTGMTPGKFREKTND